MTDYDSGRMSFARMHNTVTDRDDHHLIDDIVDENTLIADSLVEEAFNRPLHALFGQLSLESGIQMFIVFDFRNRQLRYELMKHRVDQHTWEADLVASSTLADTP